MVGAVAALTILTAGPARAVVPANVTAGKPSWSSSQLKATGSFKNNVTTSSVMYNYTLQLVRTNSSIMPTCPPPNGCVTIRDLKGVVTQSLLSAVTSSLSVAKSSVGTTPVLSVTCASNSTTQYHYWSWLKVADSSGNVVYTTSPSLTGKYC